MKIITRYLLRSHLGPLLFSFLALTGILFLNVVARRLQRLAGKGLSWDVISEYLILSIPHTAALTLPMSVLVALLYTFANLTASNEVSAMAAGGIRPVRLLLPLGVAGALLSGGMLYFNDRILPETNHRLKNLSLDIGRKSPTFDLRERIMNEIPAKGRKGQYFLQASRIDRERNELEEIVIHDLTQPLRLRSTHAKRGIMAFSPEGNDLFLTLFDGVVYEVGLREPESFQQLIFDRQIVPLRGIADVLQRGTNSGYRTDREMSISMLAETARRKDEQRDQVIVEAQLRSKATVEEALGLRRSAERDSLISMRSQRVRGGTPEDNLTRHIVLNTRTRAVEVKGHIRDANRHRVEYHKKYAISIACFVFVLIGPPLAIRFPQGGVGVVIGASVAIFSFYWAGLIGGENLADSGRIGPFWAMWTPNLVLAAIGLSLIGTMARRPGHSRAQEWCDRLSGVVLRLLPPFGRRRGAAGPAQ